MFDPISQIRKFPLRDVEQLAQDHTVRVVGSRFKSENVCRQSVNFLQSLPTKSSSEGSLVGGEEEKGRELGHSSGNTSLGQGPEF